MGYWACRRRPITTGWVRQQAWPAFGSDAKGVLAAQPDWPGASDQRCNNNPLRTDANQGNLTVYLKHSIARVQKGFYAL
jgi:hypothetical protein